MDKTTLPRIKQKQKYGRPGVPSVRGKYLLELKVDGVDISYVIFICGTFETRLWESSNIATVNMICLPYLQDKHNYKLDYNSKYAITLLL